MSDDRDRLNDEPPPFAPGEVRRDPLPMPERPVLDQSSGASVDQPRRRGGSVAVLLTLFGMLLLVVQIVVCSVGSPAGALVVGGIFAFAVFHYLIWGWWLSKTIHRQVEHEEQHPSDGSRDLP